jgi:hypothetical protein
MERRSIGDMSAAARTDSTGPLEPPNKRGMDFGNRGA